MVAQESLAKSGAGFLAIRAGSVAAAAVTNIVFARALGSHGYGLYAYVITFATLLSVPASLGLPQYLIKKGSTTCLPLTSILRWSDRWMLMGGCIAGATMFMAGLIPQAGEASTLFFVASPLPLLINFTATRQSLLQVLHRFAASQWPKLILAPAVSLAGCGMIWHLRGSVTAAQLTALAVASAVAPLCLAHRKLLAISPPDTPEQDGEALTIRAALPFAYAGCLYLANTRIDLMLLGAIHGAEAAGPYAAASRLAELVSMSLVASIAVIGPQIARTHHHGNHVALQHLVSKATFWVTICTLPAVALMILASKPMLLLLFGNEFTGASTSLQILAVAQAMNALSGPAGMLLNMTGHERLTIHGLAMSLILNIVLGLALIPMYGSIGAAIAAACSILAWNLALIFWAKKHLNIRTSFFIA